MTLYFCGDAMQEPVNKFYVTTPIYYVTARPHLGSLYSTVLADVAARWNQQLGKKTYLLTGTDEHGQKIAQAAAAANKPPKEFVDGFIDSFKETWRSYEIEYNHFIRTTDKAHIAAVQAWIKQLEAQGDIYKSSYTGFYCTPCETFVTEKDYLNLEQGKVPACPTCGRPTNFVEESCYFFKLASYADRLLKFYAENPHFITPPERMAEVLSFVQSGLKDLAISRTTITWGIPFPGDEQHVCYVWADALNNYISAIGYADPARAAEFNFWWPADLQVLGKDIIRFHAIYWPAFLMAAGLALPKKLLVHGWIKIGDQKMSKSLGNVVDPQELLATYGADAVRYYLVRHLAVTQDAPFTQEDLTTRINADLVHDLSNLVHRCMALAKAQSMAAVGEQQWTAQEDALQQKCQAMLQAFNRDMDACFYHRAYAGVWQFVHDLNAYFHAQEPWKVVKTDRAHFERVIAATVHGLYAVAQLVWPVMPQSMEKLLAMLGKTRQTGVNYYEQLLTDTWQQSFALTPQEPLFLKIVLPEPAKAEKEGTMENATALTPAITIDDFIKVELLAGTITNVEVVPKSDKLYALTVDLGPQGIRTICSGVRKHFTPEALLHKQGVFVANLAPRPMMGLVSHGMMLFGEDANGALQMVTVGAPVPNGTRLK